MFVAIPLMILKLTKVLSHLTLLNFSLRLKKHVQKHWKQNNEQKSALAK